MRMTATTSISYNNLAHSTECDEEGIRKWQRRDIALRWMFEHDPQMSETEVPLLQMLMNGTEASTTYVSSRPKQDLRTVTNRLARGSAIPTVISNMGDKGLYDLTWVKLCHLCMW